MIKQFAYNAAGLDASAINIIECNLELARQTYAGKKDADYDSKNAHLCGLMANYAIADTKFASRVASIEDETARFEASRKLFSEPMVNKNPVVRSNFAIILSQVISAINPEVSNDMFMRFIAETRQIGFGDTAVFKIESNDLFAVKDMAEGVRRTVDQPMWDDEVTVHPHLVGLSSHIDWYPFAAGRFDMGYFAVKIAKSFAAYIFVKAIRGMTAAVTQFGAAYQKSGVSANNWTELAQRVQAANGGMKVIALGTKAALHNCQIAGNLQIELGKELTEVGYLSQFLDVPLIAVDNVIAAGTVNSTGTLLIPDNIIYMCPMAGDRPVKIVFEGNQSSVDDNPEDTSDVRWGITVSQRIGVSAVCGAKYGAITI